LLLLHFQSISIHISQVTELDTRLQGMTSVLAEKNRQIDEMRRQIERSMSQNRLAQYRAEAQSSSSRTIKKSKHFR
jgi:hypothetical protein